MISNVLKLFAMLVVTSILTIILIYFDFKHSSSKQSINMSLTGKPVDNVVMPVVSVKEGIVECNKTGKLNPAEFKVGFVKPTYMNPTLGSPADLCETLETLYPIQPVDVVYPYQQTCDCDVFKFNLPP